MIVFWYAYVPRPGLDLITKPRRSVWECARVILTVHPRSFSTALATPDGVFVSFGTMHFCAGATDTGGPTASTADAALFAAFGSVRPDPIATDTLLE